MKLTSFVTTIVIGVTGAVGMSAGVPAAVAAVAIASFRLAQGLPLDSAVDDKRDEGSIEKRWPWKRVVATLQAKNTADWPWPSTITTDVDMATVTGTDVTLSQVATTTLASSTVTATLTADAQLDKAQDIDKRWPWLRVIATLQAEDSVAWPWTSTITTDVDMATVTGTELTLTEVATTTLDSSTVTATLTADVAVDTASLIQRWPWPATVTATLAAENSAAWPRTSTVTATFTEAPKATDWPLRETATTTVSDSTVTAVLTAVSPTDWPWAINGEIRV
ncbi:uncharacterized protein JN550_003573 [Neoarthrinium moseri]|uniref:uncharacterized protein n=1 Tax=Neoarthrinium moseri TaxID=1658444 RepID=UPI001FDD57AE|nr:uncharacterized protein JN550_003573 [Neoarthrinium moseri]KAI1873320.1 hypothetical protein JN550_003573 [Neoarthrinium moseri]